MSIVDCPECTAKLKPGAVSCSNCGFPLKASPASTGRRPWLHWGGLCWGSCWLLLGTEQLLVAMNVLPVESNGLSAVGVVLALAGTPLLVYGLLDKYLISRHKPLNASPRLRLAVHSLFLVGVALLCFATFAPGLRAARDAAASANASTVGEPGTSGDPETVDSDAATAAFPAFAAEVAQMLRSRSSGRYVARSKTPYATPAISFQIEFADQYSYDCQIGKSAVAPVIGELHVRFRETRRHSLLRSGPLRSPAASLQDGEWQQRTLRCSYRQRGWQLDQDIETALGVKPFNT